MKDYEYKKLLERAAAQMRKARSLVQAAESEYERRYGSHPSDIDNDNWIDSMTGSCGMPSGLTPTEVDEGAVMSGCDSYYSNNEPSR